MARAIRKPDRPGLSDPYRRSTMKRLLEAGIPLEDVAKQLGYANRASALVMATRWGLNILRPESFQNRSAAFCKGAGE